MGWLHGKKNLHSLIYAYSAVQIQQGRRDAYRWGYPGDARVDVFGCDHYCQIVDAALPGIGVIVGLADERGELMDFPILPRSRNELLHAIPMAPAQRGGDGGFGSSRDTA